MKLPIFDKKGTETKSIEAPKEVFGVAWNADLVHEVMVSMKSNARDPIAHTKDRAEVSGGGKKPWRQKGLGRARHGSIRSPLWVGGGITFGPRNQKDYSRKINKKVKAAALAMVLSRKAQDGEVILIDSVVLSDAKTKSAQDIIRAIAKHKDFADVAAKKNTSAIVALAQKDEKTMKGFRNLRHVQLDTVQNVNVLDLLNAKYIIIDNPAKAFEVLAGRVGIGGNK